MSDLVILHSCLGYRTDNSCTPFCSSHPSPTPLPPNPHTCSCEKEPLGGPQETGPVPAGAPGETSIVHVFHVTDVDHLLLVWTSVASFPGLRPDFISQPWRNSTAARYSLGGGLGTRLDQCSCQKSTCISKWCTMNNQTCEWLCLHTTIECYNVSGKPCQQLLWAGK